jgi:HAD superfamily hydrolase (TIGR01549 family)
MADNNGLSFDGIRAILFDWDGTLRHSRPTFSHTFFDLLAQSGVHGSDEQRLRHLRWVHYYWAQSPELLEDVQASEGDRERLWFLALQRYLLDYGCTQQQAADLALEIYDQMVWDLQAREDHVLPETVETLQILQAAGFKLAVVSNRSQPFPEMVDALGLAPYFEFVLAAGEVNSYKPNVEIFQHALRRVDSRPECTLFVGDSYYADVLGAQRAGLRPVLLDPEGIFPEAECPVISSLEELQGAGATRNN